MPTLQLTLDEELLRATDAAAAKEKVDRSALLREALRLHLARLRTRELEEQDRRGYERIPDTGEDLQLWEKAAAWPDDWSDSIS